ASLDDGFSLWRFDAGGTLSLVVSEPTNAPVWDVAIGNGVLYVTQETGIGILSGVATPPIVDASRVTVTREGSEARVVGTAGAVRGEAPFTGLLTSTSGGATLSAIAADGSFSATVTAGFGDSIFLEATSGSGLSSGPVMVGSVAVVGAAFEVQLPSDMTDADFVPRLLAAEATRVLVATGPSLAGEPVSDKVVVIDATDPQAWNSVLGSFAAGAEVRDMTLFWGDMHLATAAGFQSRSSYSPFGAKQVNEPGPPARAVVGDENFIYVALDGPDGGVHARAYGYGYPIWGTSEVIQGVVFEDLVFLDRARLVGVSSSEPGGIGHDLVVLDASDPAAIRVLAVADIPGATFRSARVDGTVVTLVGPSGAAAFNLSDPRNPLLIGTSPLAGVGRSITGSGGVSLVASSSGVEVLESTHASISASSGDSAFGDVADIALVLDLTYIAGGGKLHAAGTLAVPPAFETWNLWPYLYTDGTFELWPSGGAMFGLHPMVATLTGAAGSASTPVPRNDYFGLSLASSIGDQVILSVTDGAGRTAEVQMRTIWHGDSQIQWWSDTFVGRRITSDSEGRILTTSGDGFDSDAPLSSFIQHTSPSYCSSDCAIDTGVPGIRGATIANGIGYLAGSRLAAIAFDSHPETIAIAPDDPCGDLAAITSAGTTLFTADKGCAADGRIHAWDASTPMAPVLLGSSSVELGLEFESLVNLEPNYLVAFAPGAPAADAHAAWIIDRSSPTSLGVVSTVDIPGFIGVNGAVYGNLLAIAGLDDGVALVDISIPSAPLVLSITDTPGVARGVAFVDAATLAVADSNGFGLTILDVTSAQLPRVVRSFILWGTGTDVTVTGGTIYVAAEVARNDFPGLTVTPLGQDLL
ncbi:MAG: hypothetical protein LC732_01350, partial [Acidobacteria bacterium]|nr:hypothetical protein [Acidobacteriota bacterium]